MPDYQLLTEELLEKIEKENVKIPAASFFLPKSGLLTMCTAREVSNEFTEKLMKKLTSMSNSDYICSILDININDYSLLMKDGKCFECCKEKLIWPLIKQFLDNDKINPVCNLFEDSHLSSLSFKTLIYCYDNGHAENFLHLWKWFLLQRNFEIYNKILAYLIMKGGDEDFKLIMCMLEWLKSKIRFSSHWRSKTRYDIQFFSERNVNWEHIEKFIPYYGDIKETVYEKLLFDCYKNGNTNVFFKLLDVRPELKNYLPKNNEVFHLIETSTEIRDYFIEKDPNFLQELHDCIMKIPDGNLYCGIWTINFDNIFKIQMLSDLFCLKKPLRKIFNLWLNKAWCASVYVVVPNTVQHYRNTVYNIVKFFNQHNMSIRKIGNLFCQYIFNAVLEQNANFIEESYWVLSVILQHGFVFNGSPPDIDKKYLDENSRRLLRVIYLTSSQKSHFSVHLLEEIGLCPQLRPLSNLSVITLREHRKSNIGEFTEGLKLPGPIKSFVLLEDILGIIGVTMKIQISEEYGHDSNIVSHDCLVDELADKELSDYFEVDDVKD